MKDGNSLLSQVGGKFGAPMGRRNVTDNPESKALLFRMRMVDSDYDAGGAYWGGGGEPMYAAIGEDFEYYFRCQNIENAKAILLEKYPDLTIETSELNDDFFAAYVEAALFLSGDSDAGLESLNEKYGQDDIHPDSLKKMHDDCVKFAAQNHHLIKPENCIDENCWSQAGYDFWLTRNHHGAGFWDGDWTEEIGKELTDSSHSFGESELYIGDDGKLYI
jgi:hypothetical protein